MGWSLLRVIVCFVSSSVSASVFMAKPGEPPMQTLQKLCERQLLSGAVVQVKALGAQTILEKFLDEWGHRASVDLGLYLTLTYQGNQISATERAQAKDLAQRLGAQYFDEIVPVQTLEYPQTGLSFKTLEAFIAVVTNALKGTQGQKRILIVEFPSNMDLVSVDALMLILNDGNLLGIDNKDHLVLLQLHQASFPRLPLEARDGLYLLSWDAISIFGADQFQAGLERMYGDFKAAARVIVPLQ